MSTEPSEPPRSLTETSILRLLEQGEMKEKGLLPYSSNYSFLVVIEDGEVALPAVYKPRRGENPLWDFEQGTLCQREVAAYLVSTALGWQLIPPTVLRDGNHGIGSVQFYIDNDDNDHYFSIQADARFSRTLRQLALFDFIINNADRKSGHCLVGTDGQLWAIDHGICFHEEYKLRTVIWEYSQEPIELDLLTDLQTLQGQVADEQSQFASQMQQLLSPYEWLAFSSRLNQLLEQQIYPQPSVYQRNYPWPPI